MHFKRPVNALKWPTHACREAGKCVLKDVLMHVKRLTNGCKETY
jgi:hypothetical protein